MNTMQMISRADGGDEPIKFLLVDDDQISIMAIKRALKKLEFVNPIRVARDGIEALDILRGSETHPKLVPPYIITLDINMPRMNGLEFLDTIRADPSLRDAVVFILTTSDAKSDIVKAYGHNVAGYILKDNMNSSLEDALQMLGAYAKMVILPV